MKKTRFVLDRKSFGSIFAAPKKFFEGVSKNRNNFLASLFLSSSLVLGFANPTIARAAEVDPVTDENPEIVQVISDEELDELSEDLTVDTVEEVKDAVADAASDIKDAVVESVSDVKETVSDAVDEIKE